MECFLLRVAKYLTGALSISLGRRLDAAMVTVMVRLLSVVVNLMAFVVKLIKT